MTVVKFRKKPVVIEAVQFNGRNTHEVLEFASEADAIGVHDVGVVIHTLEGDMTASPGDWIIKGVAGEFYPCKPDVFAATYEMVPCECENPDCRDCDDCDERLKAGVYPNCQHRMKP